MPEGVSPCPAVVFVHGAGRNTRKQHREIGKHFASNGIAALIYDKRGTGESGGVYESHEPYKNLVDDALAAVDLLKQRPEIAQSQIGIWGLSQGAYISAAAASRTKDIKFVITAGASVADGSFFYYCDNLFRKHGLSDTLRDLAAKGHFVTMGFERNYARWSKSLVVCTAILSAARPIPPSRMEPRHPASFGNVGRTGSKRSGR